MSAGGSGQHQVGLEFAGDAGKPGCFTPHMRDDVGVKALGTVNILPTEHPFRHCYALNR